MLKNSGSIARRVAELEKRAAATSTLTGGADALTVESLEAILQDWFDTGFVVQTDAGWVAGVDETDGRYWHAHSVAELLNAVDLMIAGGDDAEPIR